MNRTLVWAALSIMLLAGCADTAEPEAAAVAVDDTDSRLVTLAGIVQDEAIQPIAGAIVSIPLLDANVTTGVDGRFEFAELPFSFYVLTANAPDHAGASLTFNPHDPGDMLFVLARVAETPRHVTVPFSGIIQCAAEYIIITPSCDTITEYTAEQGVPLPDGGSITEDVSEFDLQLESNWKTVVVDLVFDVSDQPALEAMRTVVAGTNDPNQVTQYDQYGRFNNATSYTFRLEPDQSYPEGDKVVPGNSTALRFNVYGQGHGWHATCEATCTLGVGGGLDVEFELFATVFYVDPAPEAWSFLQQ